jgi:tripartite-type tricarboxylate transporter receptor subunit TctC
MVFETWYGLFGPSALPRDVVSSINASINALLSQPEFRNQLARQGVTPIGGTPESLDKFFRGEVDKFAKVIRASGAKPE